MEKTSVMYQKALEFATLKHKGQVRFDGSPYINHPIRVASNVRKFKKSKSLEILEVAAIIHDTLEDTDTTFDELVELFGVHVAYLVLEVTINEEMKKRLGKTTYLELEMRGMSSYGLVIKLCDRLDNVSDLDNASPSFRVKYVKETLEILNYVFLNRNLTRTHLDIIKSINRVIKDLINKYDELKSDSCILSLECRCERIV